MADPMEHSMNKRGKPMLNSNGDGGLEKIRYKFLKKLKIKIYIKQIHINFIKNNLKKS
ncbi:hypothetical protein Msip34_0792 [Methylovorus glucosotrophus SIP3-4]|uniref:Uncharacterized protein n=1 Tax=Methylovorus glucosotrophus (strain SIP3-4) TaxID=582744 RepID=C6XBW5_METGS|nr:hypothetical protein Msip34_0792 [Methylovorus glucosotrophus SIP3-4]